MKRSILTALALSAALLGGRAEACTVHPPLYPAESPEAIAEERKFDLELADGIAREELVFVGRVLRERLPNIAEILLTSFDEGPPGVRSWFEPEQVLKGEADFPTTNIFSGAYGSTCGYGPSLEVGATVVVYAKRVGEYWYGYTAPAEILRYLEPLLR